MKTCSLCGQAKPSQDFYRDRTRADGRTHRCKECDKAKAWAWQRANREKACATRRAWRLQHIERYKATRHARHARRRIEERAVIRDKNRRRRAAMRAGMSDFDKEVSVEYRRAIFGDACRYCGELRDVMQTDHYAPIAMGGTDEWFNLTRACQTCNAVKGVRCGTWMLLRSPALATL